MGNPIKDTQRDFWNKEILDAIEQEPFDLIDLEIDLGHPDDIAQIHQKNIKRMQKAEAVKNDRDKTRMDLLPPKALEGIAKIFTFGAKKYNDYNYKNGEGLDWSRPYAAMMRHLNAWNDGEDNDPETGQSHLYHAGCCIMMLIDLVDSEKGKDTRFKI